MLAVEGDDVVVRFTGLEPAWALRRRVRFPRSAVDAAEVVARPPLRGARAPGTRVPGLVTAGTWRGRFGKDLWFVRRGDRVLVLELGGGAPFRRVVLELDDPDEAAALVR